ncbi:Thrombospondin type-1 (TSP1) repeat [Trinorchestia longiramus]|nr:Thrombospondin type-1 (TSP1) repeat [Trinorchestia longiramus]
MASMQSLPPLPKSLSGLFNFASRRSSPTPSDRYSPPARADSRTESRQDLRPDAMLAPSTVSSAFQPYSGSAEHSLGSSPRSSPRSLTASPLVLHPFVQASSYMQPSTRQEHSSRYLKTLQQQQQYLRDNQKNLYQKQQQQRCRSQERLYEHQYQDHNVYNFKQEINSVPQKMPEWQQQVLPQMYQTNSRLQQQQRHVTPPWQQQVQHPTFHQQSRNKSSSTRKHQRRSSSSSLGAGGSTRTSPPVVSRTTPPPYNTRTISSPLYSTSSPFGCVGSGKSSNSTAASSPASGGKAGTPPVPPPKPRRPSSLDSQLATLRKEMCTVSCGGGVQRREVKCLDDHLLPSLLCPAAAKPDTRQTCATNKCTQETLIETSISNEVDNSGRVLAEAAQPQPARVPAPEAVYLALSTWPCLPRPVYLALSTTQSTWLCLPHSLPGSVYRTVYLAMSTSPSTWFCLLHRLCGPVFRALNMSRLLSTSQTTMRIKSCLPRLQCAQFPVYSNHSVHSILSTLPVMPESCLHHLSYPESCLHHLSYPESCLHHLSYPESCLHHLSTPPVPSTE